jgi:hypothetical protein
MPLLLGSASLFQYLQRRNDPDDDFNEGTQSSAKSGQYFESLSSAAATIC